MERFIALGIQASVFLLVFSLGLNVTMRERLYLIRRPGLGLRSLFAMNVVMPLVASALAVAFDLHPAVKIALIALAVSPVPPILPRKELKAGGCAEYAFALLVTAVLFSIVFVPAAVHVLGRAFGTSVYVPAAAIAKVVLWTALIPLAAGLAFRYLMPELSGRIEKPLGKIALLALIVSILPVLFIAWPVIVSLARDGALVAIVLFSVIGFAAGHLLGGPEDSTRTVLALSTASRHPGVAAAIANIGFPQQKAAIAAILLVLLVNAVASKLYLVWRHRRIPESSRRAA